MGFIENVNVLASDTSVMNSLVADKATLDRIFSSINNIDRVFTSIDNVDTVTLHIANIDTNAANIQAIIDSKTNADNAKASELNAANSATSAANSASISQAAADSIAAITVANTYTLDAGQPADVTYNQSTSELTFAIPKGDKGDKGDSFTVNAMGHTADRALYDTQTTGFSFLDLDVSLVYFKMSDTSGDWSAGAPFGKGDKGDTGVGIASITFTSTTDASGNPAQSGATDTYTITYTDSTTATFNVYNGLDSAVLSVAGRTGDVILTSADVGLGNADNTADVDKPISTATQSALNLKADITYVDSQDALKLNAINPSITGSVTEQVATCNLALDPANGTIQTYTATADFTLTDSLAEGQYLTFILTSGGFTPTYPTITWWEGAEPKLQTTDKLYFEKIGGVLYGSQIASIK